MILNNFLSIQVKKTRKLYLNSEVKPDLIKLISEKLNEHEQSNPFDRLEPGQRVHFELVQTKLGTNYVQIQDNINRIVDEIDNKNKLVDKYFSDATMSYRISIIALLIGLLALLPMVKNFWGWLRKKTDPVDK